MEKAYKKGDMLEAEIVDMDTDGLGIGKHEGYTLFVKDAVAGDVCRVKIMKAKKIAKAVKKVIVKSQVILLMRVIKQIIAFIIVLVKNLII